MGINTNLPLLPILIPMITGILLFFARKRVLFHRTVSAVSALAMVAAAVYLLCTVKAQGMLVFCAGGWSAPYGITFAVDLFSCIMVLMGSILSFTGLLFSYCTIDREKEIHDYYILWQFLMLGINGTFVTGDLFNLYVFFEIMLIASYGILVIGGSKPQLRETFKYLLINIVSSIIFLIALGTLYSMIGSVNMADVAAKIATVEDPHLATVSAMLLFIVFGVKGAMFPLYFWLPKVHTVAAAAVSSIFSGLLIKVGVCSMVRAFTLIFVGDSAYTHTFIMIVGVLTMFFGVFGAVSQMNYKSILAYHSISQVGYMVAGLGLFTVSSVAGTIYFIVHHAFVKACLFLTAGVAEEITGTKELKKMGGLLGLYPALGFLFFLAAMSLAGVPPLSGFFGKLMLLLAAADLKNYWMIACAMAVGVLTLFSMVKIFMYAYWGTPARSYTPAEGFLPSGGKRYLCSLIPIAVLGLLTACMGLFAQPVLSLCTEAAEQMMDPRYYIDAVLYTVGGRH
ncbi:proton-conducting transporter transmembrane domain-containing protein [Bacilliculturomica massiliensis]|uniref:proton-conducting transporter transmembrane domain-containing protein n=1 Tax=Bacilliculturomica massiliensis TaxID=1917867 RepID=UPI0010302E74|nr:proton-conducting transporter membrane subunit [Bacilliculturomica massiliensis]